MIGRIALICAIALALYVIAPAVSQFARRARYRSILGILKDSDGILGSCVGISGGLLRFRAVRPGSEAAESRAAAPIPGESRETLIDPRRARIFMLQTEGDLEAIPWKSVFLLKEGITLARFEGAKNRSICLFHGEKDEAELRGRILALRVPERLPDPAKHYFVAAGAFLEFCAFIATIQADGMTYAGIAALVAIFGKALPYCPPGLFFTLGAHFAGQKKGRWHGAIGALLMAAGILLNVTVIFFVIRRVGFVYP